MMSQDLKSWVPKLAGQRVLAVGDVILDEYLIGRAVRLSREAPVPVLEFEARQLIAGGAANPAANIVRLGSQALQFGVTGVDAAADVLRRVIQDAGIDTRGLVSDASRPTTVKMRIMAQMGLRFPQQVARLDTLSREHISPAVEAQLVQRIEANLPQANAVLVSDYHGGMLTESLAAAVREKAALHRVLLAADAQGDLSKYVRFDLVKCNADDARRYLRRGIEGDEEFAQAARELCVALALRRAMVITRGPEGATISASGGETHHCPAPSVTDVYDVVGAGDTSIAVLTLALAAGAGYADSMTLANYASGLVVRRVGNYSPTSAELIWALENWV